MFLDPDLRNESTDICRVVGLKVGEQDGLQLSRAGELEILALAPQCQGASLACVCYELCVDAELCRSVYRAFPRQLEELLSVGVEPLDSLDGGA